ncbi:MAG TPA: hypothetical protein ENK27_10960, partial [Desulfobulbus sp.]|nr:hypothetical protein [Desulfobulbus sp.]
MFGISRLVILSLAALLLLGSCGGKKAVIYTGKTYPPTEKVGYAFLPSQVPPTCRVFAQVLVTLPADSTGKSIRDSITDEARMR